jgi:hypothetical protein
MGSAALASFRSSALTASFSSLFQAVGAADAASSASALVMLSLRLTVGCSLVWIASMSQGIGTIGAAGRLAIDGPRQATGRSVALTLRLAAAQRQIRICSAAGCIGSAAILAHCAAAISGVCASRGRRFRSVNRFTEALAVRLPMAGDRP